MTVALSVVALVFNEGPILENLARRCALAAEATGLTFEILLVDDASTDDTRAIADGLDIPGLRFLHLPKNCGQFGATRSGLREAMGDRVIVLDGDLQDPPEEITPLVAAMDAADRDVVFAVKEQRVDAGWMKLAVGLYGLLQQLGGRTWPTGAGSYCIMTRSFARKVARLNFTEANLAAALLALDARVATMPYSRERHWDGISHIGAAGLAKEGLESLALTGALPRIIGVVAVAVAALGALSGPRGRGLIGLGILGAGGALVLHRHTRTLVDEARGEPNRV